MPTPRKRKREADVLPIEDVKNPDFLTKSSQSSRSRDYQVSQSNFQLKQEERSRQWSKVLPSSTWKTSEPIGGRLINAEPIFAGEEKYFLLAYDGAIKVYSASTSSLVRSLPAATGKPGEATVTAYALSSTNPNTLYVSNTKGHIYHWDWRAGEQLDRWNAKAQIYGLATSALAIGDSTVDVVYTREKRGMNWMIAAYNLAHGKHSADRERAQLYVTNKPISRLHVTPSGENIVASYGEYLVVGVTNDRELPSFSKMEFVWRELWTPERITCLDVREIVTRQWSRATGAKGRAKHLKSQHSLDIVVGGLKGVIYVHEDLLHKLNQKEREAQLKAAINLTPLKFHWHREAVATVKWSVDGNYIISGGAETVLVLWQLDTGKTQFLPHLSSAIESVVVSPTGSSYAIRLADNSALVISTTELTPKTSVAGIQTRCLRPAPPHQVYVQSVDTMEVERSNPVDPGLLKTPASIHPLFPTQVLIAVPASQPRAAPSMSYASAPYLQTFDFSAGRHVSHQALTWTNATTINLGPQANRIIEPDVKLMQISHDGQWLLTVDEWLQPRSDIDFLACSKSETAEMQSDCREVFLKFWAWNVQRRDWELSTRIDEPHPARDGHASTSNVLDLAAAPDRLSFATLGEDGDVRVWNLKTRLRDGVVVRGRNAEGLMSWGCQYSVSLASFQDLHVLSSGGQRGFLAYSTDGSVLVAALQHAAEQGIGTVYFIDPIIGKVQQAQSGLYSGDLFALNLVGRYLVLVSATIAVWDIVLGELLYKLSLQPTKLTTEQTAAMTHLAVDPLSETFAVSLPRLDFVKPHKASLHEVRRHGSAITIFSPSDPKPLYSNLLAQPITSLLPIVGSKSYLALNAACEISVLAPMTSPYTFTNGATTKLFESSIDLPPATRLIKEDDEDSKGIYVADGVHVSDQTKEELQRLVYPRSSPNPAEAVDYGPPTIEEDDIPVVRQEQLANIFDIGPAFAMPPMGDLFEQVAALCSKQDLAA
ncbi:MAG: hypothetical protein M1835_007648 [Candelina submexicana]|nr:MAG: hypothetical protein M1835_007648 [Candelina submexicana]